MKILIGTPIHECKDYSMKRWIENVSKLEYPADLLLVDNSPTPKYMEKVKGYLNKYGVKNYQIEHFEIDQKLDFCLRIERSQEIIRQYVLSHDYDAWFSWECDQIIPPNALSELVRIMEAGNFMMVNHNSWVRVAPGQNEAELGCSLIKKEALTKTWFLPIRNGEISFEEKDIWPPEDSYCKHRVMRGGGNYTDVYGVINPICHLDK
jgi:hypothetical protein